MNANPRLVRVAREALHERGLLDDFPREVDAEVSALRHAASDPSARDMRDLLWASIDNDDSRDLDQLSVAAEPHAHRDGSDTIYVAIADVDALVKKGSPVDTRARTNTTSIYTAAGNFPMLPERLCTDLTSLNPEEDRLAIVVEMNVNAAGEVARASLFRATVRNHAKLAYDGVAAWLDGQAAAPPALDAVSGLPAQLRRQHAIAQRLKRMRESRGALDLDTLEARPIMSDRTLSDLAPDESNHAKELIEDFMVAANGAIARFLTGRGYAYLRRVLPIPERWDRIRILARANGGRLPAQPDAIALDAFLRERRAAEPDTFPDLSLSVIKLLGFGEYALDGTGHFALAVDTYTHATAPNRRYPDLVTQRVLKAALSGGASPYARNELAALADHCTQQQKAAAKVERRVAKSAAAQILSSRIGQTFSAIVTGASEKGTWVRIRHPTTEGRVIRGERGLDVGDRVTVKLLRTDIDRGFIDFAAPE
ncbi:MAG: RNB domain-containing ribonuclease [Burkholderiales bacterium]